eukprot:COSAG03_NODE_74_length_14441_cov_13.158974_11_plen_51_part_00
MAGALGGSWMRSKHTVRENATHTRTHTTQTDREQTLAGDMAENFACVRSD